MKKTEFYELNLIVRGTTREDLNGKLYDFVTSYHRDPQSQHAETDNAGNYYYYVTTAKDRKGKEKK